MFRVASATACSDGEWRRQHDFDTLDVLDACTKLLRVQDRVVRTVLNIFQLPAIKGRRIGLLALRLSPLAPPRIGQGFHAGQFLTCEKLQ